MKTKYTFFKRFFLAGVLCFGLGTAAYAETQQVWQNYFTWGEATVVQERISQYQEDLPTEETVLGESTERETPMEESAGEENDDVLHSEDGYLLTGPISDIGEESIFTYQIVDLAVTTSKLADESVTSSKIASDAVNAKQIAPDAVGASEIIDGSVGASEIADGAVRSSEVEDGSLMDADIAEDAGIDAEKIDFTDKHIQLFEGLLAADSIVASTSLTVPIITKKDFSSTCSSGEFAILSDTEPALAGCLNGKWKKF